jgi:nucleotide-binding universal stress UspA family protein
VLANDDEDDAMNEQTIVVGVGGGDNGREAAARVLLGSVAHGAVDQAHWPVMVAHDAVSREDQGR